MKNNVHKYGSVGIFDSGVGGLTVVKQVREYFPGTGIVYFGDTLHNPYGNKSINTIRGFALTLMEFLAQTPIRAIFIGCNTSSSALLGTNLHHIQVPVFGLIVPGMMAAAKVTKTGKVGVIANPPTAKSGVHQNVLDEYGLDVECFAVPCPELVPLVEAGKYDCPEMDAVMTEYLAPIREAGCDVLIHGCTHYPLAQPSIDRLWPEALIVDPAEEMVKSAIPILRKQERFREPLEEDIYMLSKEWPTFEETAELFLGERLPEPMIINIWELPPESSSDENTAVNVDQKSK
jgi:glutamate racemase